VSDDLDLPAHVKYLLNDVCSMPRITVATVASFLSAALASTHQFCYSALASGSVVLILPGYIVLSGALELASRGIISGAVRMGYSVIYSWVSPSVVKRSRANIRKHLNLAFSSDLG
jgi:hypothetical protein